MGVPTALPVRTNRELPPSPCAVGLAAGLGQLRELPGSVAARVASGARAESASSSDRKKHHGPAGLSQKNEGLRQA